jgi:dTDP-4-dehydrorhamnose reductase
VKANTKDYLIVRTAWLYGEFGKCFPKTMRDLSGNRETLDVVTDEIGQPTWTVDLADLIVRLVLASAPSGIYHGTSSGETSWNEFAKEVMASIGKDRTVVKPTTASAFRRAAQRPHYSVLGHHRLSEIGVEPIGDWRERWSVAAPAVLN